MSTSTSLSPVQAPPYNHASAPAASRPGNTELHMLIGSQGNIPLAAERMQLTIPEFTRRILENDEATIISAVKSSLVLNMVDLAANLKIALIASLDEMAADKVAKTLVDILNTFKNITTEGPLAQINENNQILQVMGNDASTARERIFSQLLGIGSAKEGSQPVTVDDNSESR